MRSKLVLKEKNERKVIYFYSCDESIDTIDGEIEYNIETEEMKTVKKATNDSNGFFAEWLYPHVWRTIIKEGAPPTRYIATG